jgi:serine/threonine protein kinase/tetratricopeptide (TPR) repeat protein
MAIKCPKCQAENPDTKQFCGDCGTRLTPAQEARPELTETLQTPVRELTSGSNFAGRYQVIEELGHGGMGRVYKVQDTKIGEKIALKLLRPEAGLDEKSLERFSNELKLARKIRHKNVCQMFDLGEDQGARYITMEYVHGEDLKQLVRKVGRLSPGQAVGIARQVCDGLEEAHKLGVVHRDLKPQNIMVDEEGKARIMDFGIARSLSGRGVTGAGVLIGTPEYMSPEQVEGKDIDQRSDLYSLGVILYEMVTGQVPFEGETALSIAHKHKYEAPEDPKKLNTQVSNDLASVILKCLEKDKTKRYQSASDVHSELGRIEQGLSTTDRTVRKRKALTSKEITSTLGIRKLARPVLVFLALAVVFVLAFVFFSRKKPVSELVETSSVAIMPFDDLSQDKTHEYIGNGIADTLTTALSTIQGLKVPARTSAFSLKGKDMDVRSIGQKLNVKNVLEGSVQVVGDKLRITARLSSAADGFQIWSEVYEKTSKDIFAIQDDIAQKIIKAMKIRLLGEKETQVVHRYTNNREAYDSYMQGLYFEAKRGKANLEKAVTSFQAAIDKDPTYALAFARLANTLRTMVAWHLLPGRDAFPRAREAANRALELDPSLSEAHTALAEVKYLFDWDKESAEKEFKMAIALNPNDSNAHKEYGQYLFGQGRREEALQEYKKAQELDPLSLLILAQLGWFLPDDEQIKYYEKILEMDPDFQPPQLYLVRPYISKGMYDKTLALLEKLDRQPEIGYAYVKMGKISEARQVLNKLLENPSQYPDPWLIAKLCFLLGKNNEGFDWLDKAYEDRDRGLFGLDSDPDFKNARRDPRFQAMLKKIGLEK